MRFLRVRTVVEMVGLSKSTLYARIRDGSFPRPIQIGAQTVAFLESEVFDWMKDKAAKRTTTKSAEKWKITCDLPLEGSASQSKSEPKRPT
jgi:prophage regulatory protein